MQLNFDAPPFERGLLCPHWGHGQLFWGVMSKFRSLGYCLCPFLFYLYENFDTMKIFTIMALLCANLCYSQCKYEINEVDKFTKKTILKTKYTALWQSMVNALSFKATKIDASMFLEMTYSTSSIYSIEKGSKLMFLMSNDSIVTLTAVRYETANGVSTSVGTIWSAIVDYYLSEKDRATLMGSTVVNVRIYARDGYIDKKIKSKRAGNLRKILPCI